MTSYEMRIIDWSSDVCSSDLGHPHQSRFPDRRRGGRDGRGGRRPYRVHRRPAKRIARSLIEQGRTLMTMSQTALVNATRDSKRIPSAARAVMLAIAGSALIAVCARIQVPMWPVPMTMPPFAVLLIGLAYGTRSGAATVALYPSEGPGGPPGAPPRP